MARRRNAGGLAALAAAALLLAVASRVPFAAAGGDDALLRLSWRLVSERVEACREPTAEELERLPVHMRRDRICERRTIPYRLHVRIDGQEVRSRRIEPSGARRDGPLFVYEEVRLRPGVHQVEVVFEPTVPNGRDQTVALPEPLALAQHVQLRPRRVALVTVLPGTRLLEVRYAETRAGR